MNIEAEDYKPCAYCGKLTNLIDFCSEQKLCSEECGNKYYDEIIIPEIETECSNNLQQEEKVLNLLSDAWNEYLKLDTQHPSEKDYFADGMNLCQMAVGMRFARQNRPDLFPVKE